VRPEIFDASLLARVALLLAPGLPLALSMALLPRTWRGPVIAIAPWAALPAFAIIAFSPATLDLPWLLLGVRLGVDETARVFLFFTAVLWLLTGVYARHYLAGDPARTRFFAFYLVTMSGNIGLILSQDVLSFYLFFALMSFSAYGLIVHNRDAQTRWAGRVYISLVVVGEVLLFAGLVVGAYYAGSLDLARFAGGAHSNLVIALLLVGFGIKVGALPLHVWLPLAYSAAPTPAGAVLGGAMINAGLLGWLRFLPLGQVALPEWGVLLIAAGIGAAIYAVLVGLFQDEPKTVLAYSSISQMGLITIGFGVGAAEPEAWPLCLSVILLYALHHALAKGALFLGVGVATRGSRGATGRRLVIAGLLIPALALAGLPFTGGFIAKTGLTSLVEVLPVPWSGLMTFGLSVVALGTTLLMARFLYLIGSQRGRRSGRGAGLWVPWVVLLSLVACLAWMWPAASSVAPQSLSVVESWHAIWPVVLGALIAAVVWLLSRNGAIRLAATIPPGDMLTVATWCSNCMRRAWSRTVDHCRQNVAHGQLFWRRAVTGAKAFDADRLFENTLQRWRIGGIAFLFLLVLVFVILALARHQGTMS
jgi:formate hydrogenlyase subunit 3/multisubunit Na+/H+ antiporter MnhD subunit